MTNNLYNLLEMSVKYVIIIRLIRGCSSVGRALEWHSRGKGFDPPHLHQRGQLTQLVECLRHMEEVRGSSPLLPTRQRLRL
jgi:hypothetical protein